MKKLVFLMLVCLLTISSVLLASCDVLSTSEGTSDSTEAITSDTEKTAEETVPDEPVAVGDLNGKNPKQLCEGFFNEYSTAKSYDMEVSMISVADESSYVDAGDLGGFDYGAPSAEEYAKYTAVYNRLNGMKKYEMSVNTREYGITYQNDGSNKYILVQYTGGESYRIWYLSDGSVYVAINSGDPVQTAASDKVKESINNVEALKK